MAYVVVMLTQQPSNDCEISNCVLAVIGTFKKLKDANKCAIRNAEYHPHVMPLDAEDTW